MTNIQETRCPKCGSKMIPRDSKFGKFWGCFYYPACKGTRDSMGRSKKDRDVEESEDEEELNGIRWDR